jgi:hypothetical protein
LRPADGTSGQAVAEALNALKPDLAPMPSMAVSGHRRTGPGVNGQGMSVIG